MATLLDIRTQFIVASGRFDLATPVNVWITDNGADFFINAGLRYLDGLQETPQTSKVWVQTVSQGDHDITLTGVRALREVWYVNSDGDLVEAKKQDLQYINETYPDGAATTEGAVVDWAIDIARYADGGDVGGIAAGSHQLLLFPPSDEAITLYAYGDFTTKAMSDNADTNWWSIRHEDMLVMAALMRLEGFYRNTQGVRDYREQIFEMMQYIDRDLVNEGMPENEDLVMRG